MDKPLLVQLCRLPKPLQLLLMLLDLSLHVLLCSAEKNTNNDIILTSWKQHSSYIYEVPCVTIIIKIHFALDHLVEKSASCKPNTDLSTEKLSWFLSKYSLNPELYFLLTQFSPLFLSFEFELLQFLLLFLCFSPQSEVSPRLNSIIMSGLERLWCHVATIHNLQRRYRR